MITLNKSMIMDIVKNKCNYSNITEIGIFLMEYDKPLIFIHNDILILYNSIRTDSKPVTIVSDEFIDVVLKYTTYRIEDGDLLFKLYDNEEVIVIDEELVRRVI